MALSYRNRKGMKIEMKLRFSAVPTLLLKLNRISTVSSGRREEGRNDFRDRVDHL